MKVRNLTKKTLVTEELKVAESFTDKIAGLLKKSNPRAMLFKTRFGIHTFGMKEAIDVLVLDGKLRVRGIKESLDPNRVFFWNPSYENIIELAEGTIRKSNTEVWDTLRIEN